MGTWKWRCPGGQLPQVNLSEQGERPVLWERAYRYAPAWAAAWLFGGCRPIEALPFVVRAGFRNGQREFARGWLASEIIEAWK